MEPTLRGGVCTELFLPLLPKSSPAAQTPGGRPKDGLSPLTLAGWPHHQHRCGAPGHLPGPLPAPLTQVTLLPTGVSAEAAETEPERLWTESTCREHKVGETMKEKNTRKSFS